jgi:hypothetical protein
MKRVWFVLPFAVLGLIFLPAPDSSAQTHWSCVDDGPRICEPGNPDGKPAGCYDDGGVLEFEWPCRGWVPADGWVHGDGSVSFPDGHTTPPEPQGRADGADHVVKSHGGTGQIKQHYTKG